MKNLKEHALLSEHSTMKVGGNARYLVEIKDKAELSEAITFAKANGLPTLFVGGGSNILFDDIGFHGVVIKIAHKGIMHFEEMGEVFVLAEAGENWDDFVKWTLDHGFFGLENLSGIPGLVGGAPIQNIGAYGVEVGELIDLVEVFDTSEMKFKYLSRSECGFGYRDTIFKKPEGKHLIVTAVRFRMSLLPNVKISYKDLANHFKDSANPTPLEVREAVLLIRSRKFPDLKKFGTAGSFFKNVICDCATAERLKAEYPDLPVFDAGEGKKKLSTAFILDKICGLKGLREGDVGLFPNQSLVVVNYGRASSDDIKRFITKIKNIVKEKTNIELEEEVVIIK